MCPRRQTAYRCSSQNIGPIPPGKPPLAPIQCRRDIRYLQRPPCQPAGAEIVRITLPAPQVFHFLDRDGICASGGICLPPLNFDRQAFSALFSQAIRLFTDQRPDSELRTTLRLARERTSDSKGDPQIHDARVVLEIRGGLRRTMKRVPELRHSCATQASCLNMPRPTSTPG
jgi:hypothetical protein